MDVYELYRAGLVIGSPIQRADSMLESRWLNQGRELRDLVDWRVANSEIGYPLSGSPNAFTIGRVCTDLFSV